LPIAVALAVLSQHGLVIYLAAANYFQKVFGYSDIALSLEPFSSNEILVLYLSLAELMIGHVWQPCSQKVLR